MKIDTFSKRLKEALRIRNIRQIELSEKTHIPKSAICQYLSGKFEPKQDRLSDIAAVLEVSEAWLMGFDVPMEEQKKSEKQHYQSKPFTDETLYEMFYNSFVSGCPYTMDMLHQMCTPYNVKDNSMFPSYRDGDKVLILLTSHLEHNGEIALISYKDAVSLKRVEYSEDDNSYVLSHINPNIPPIIVKGDNLAYFKILGVPTLMIRQMPIE